MQILRGTIIEVQRLRSCDFCLTKKKKKVDYWEHLLASLAFHYIFGKTRSLKIILKIFFRFKM